jgi:hypothetical protein
MKKQFLREHIGNQTEIARELHLKAPSVCVWTEELPFCAIGRVAIHRPDLMRLWWREQKKNAPE